MYSERVWARIQLANELRQNPTPAEERLRDYMADAFGRESFKHSRVLGGYIADFFFPDEGIVVEVDGESHDNIERWLKDRVRDMRMAQEGLLVLRFRNEDVFERSGWVIARIEAALRTHRNFPA
jgi:very-short-patch-repair endonuclease